MPKKTFSFDVTGRKLFAAERVAVDAFVRKYPTGGEASVLPQRAAKELADHAGPVAADAKAAAAPKWTNKRKPLSLAQKKKTSGFGPMPSAVIKGLIFGVPAVPEVKPAATAKRTIVTTASTGATAASKPAPTKRGASRTARV